LSRGQEQKEGDREKLPEWASYDQRVYSDQEVSHGVGPLSCGFAILAPSATGLIGSVPPYRDYFDIELIQHGVEGALGIEADRYDSLCVLDQGLRNR
jgi:hypothetical protein